MIGIPLGGMRGEGRVGRGLEVGAEHRFLVVRDRPCATRSLVGGEIAGRFVAANPAGDTALADLEEPDNGAAGHALGVRRDHACA